MNRNSSFTITIGSALFALLISFVILRLVLSRDEFIPFRYLDLVLVGVGGLIIGFLNFRYWWFASLVMLFLGIYLLQIFLDRLVTPNLFVLLYLFLGLLASILGGYIGSFLRRFYLVRTNKVVSDDEKEKAGDVKDEINVSPKKLDLLAGFLGYFLLGIILGRLFSNQALYMIAAFLMYFSFILVWILVIVFLILRRWVAYGLIAGWGINFIGVLLIELTIGDFFMLNIISSALGSPLLATFLLEIITN